VQPSLPFPFNMPPAVTFAILACWLFFFLTGRLQLRKTRKLAERLILSHVSDLEARPRMTLREFHALVLPEFKEQVRGTIWYVPHRTELFPIPARPETVVERLGLSPEYVGRILIREGIELKGRDFRKLKGDLETQSQGKRQKAP
jgi:hypothetical protein